MTQSYSSEEESNLDDDFLDRIDPHANARWDKVEGPKERAAYCLAMEERLSPQRNTIEDKIIVEIIELIKEYDDIFAQTPKAPGMSPRCVYSQHPKDWRPSRKPSMVKM